jgi:hypothetical protein
MCMTTFIISNIHFHATPVKVIGDNLLYQVKYLYLTILLQTNIVVKFDIKI